MAPNDRSIEMLAVGQVRRILKMLAKQLKASKRVRVCFKGVVTYSRPIPDHRTQLRAVTELAKMHGLFPRRGERHARDRYDHSTQPVINLVMRDTN